MRDYAQELDKRVHFIQEQLTQSHTSGLIFGNSGGKDCALVGILCKRACDDTLGVIMPCQSVSNYHQDKEDAEALAAQFDIRTIIVDLSAQKEQFIQNLSAHTTLTESGIINIAPRLRMTTLYTVAASENRLVVGTGNRSERHMGYFTKWGDGACDLNPIADLTATEVFEFLRFLNAPPNIIEKAPSAGLFEGQTDEAEMGITYAALDRYLLTGEGDAKDLAIITRYHGSSHHKRCMPLQYRKEEEIT